LDDSEKDVKKDMYSVCSYISVISNKLDGTMLNIITRCVNEHFIPNGKYIVGNINMLYKENLLSFTIN